MSTTCRYCDAAARIMIAASVLERSGAELSCLFSTEAMWRAHRDSPAASKAYTDARDLFALGRDLRHLDPQVETIGARAAARWNNGR